MWLTMPRIDIRAMPRSGIVNEPSSRARAQDLVEKPLEAFARLAHLPPGRIGLDQPALLVEDDHVVAVARHVRDPGAQKLAQLLLGREVLGGDLLGPGEQRLDQLLVREEEEVLLAVDVVVEPAALEPRRLDEVVDRGVAVAALGEQPGRDVDHLAAPVLPAWPRALMPASSRTAIG